MDQDCQTCADEGRKTTAALLFNGKPLCGECWENDDSDEEKDKK